MAKSVKKPIAKKSVAKAPVINKRTGLPLPFQLLLLAALLVLTALVYMNSLHGAILNFDDVEYFNNHPEVLRLTWKNIGMYFSHYYVIMYQPLPVLSFAINYHFSSLNTLPMHVVNLFFHLSNIILVYYLIKKVSERFDVAFIVAILFALHPLNVEAVSWISARSSGMYTFFYFLSLVFYIDYIKKGLKWRYIIVAFLFFILSLFSKAQAVTLPVVLLLFDYYFKRKLISWRTLLEKIPFFALSIVFGIVAMSDAGTMANITKGMMQDYSLFDAFFLVCYSFVFYFFKLLVPFSLASVYVYPPKMNGHLPIICYFTPAILAVIAFLIFKLRHYRYVILGAGLFFITISLNIQIIPSRLFIVTERYAYFPFIGLFFIIGMFYDDLAKKKSPRLKQLRSLITAVLAIYTIAFSYTIYERNKIWKSDIPFMTDILHKNPEVPYLSRAYGNRGHAYSLMNDYPDAIKDFSDAIRLKSDEGISYFNRGLCYYKLQKYQEAIADYDLAVKYNGGAFVVYSNRAVAKFDSKDYPGTVNDCNLATKMDSTKQEVYNTRAAAEFYLKDFTGAERDFTKSIALDPKNNESLKNRGNLYYQLKRLPEACADWKKAAEMGNEEARKAVENYCK
jgi:protein O-mannosyl-transferase